MLPASPFMLAHEISDFVFFATVAPVLYAACAKWRSVKGPRIALRPSTGALEPDDI